MQNKAVELVIQISRESMFIIGDGDRENSVPIVMTVAFFDICYSFL